MRNLYKNGFSLVELLISIGVLGLIAAMSVPYVRTSISSLNLTNASKEIVTDLREAQQRTVTEQSNFYVQFIEAENKYRLIKESTGEIIKEKTLASEIDLYAVNDLTDGKAKFNFFGAAIETGTIILTNTSTNATSTIEIKPSGYVQYN